MENHMIAYHGKDAVKKKYLGRIKAHAAADELVQGTGWEDGKGCAVGCTLEAYDHSRYETELGIPRQLAQIEDAIFEGLPNAEAMRWPEKFLSAIKPGADLGLVFPRFMVWMLTDPNDGVIRFADKDGEKAIRAVSDMFLKWTKDGKPAVEWAWSAAESAAWSAAWSAAESAAESAAWSAAKSAAESAAESAARSAAKSAAWSAAKSAARSAAKSAAWSAAESAARSAAKSAAKSAARSAAWSAAKSAAESAAYRSMAAKLLELLGECQPAAKPETKEGA
jgi:hypothetical protein